MLVSKSKATSLLKSEKKTLTSFLFLYAFFSIVILIFSAFIYYNLQRDNMLEDQNNRLKEYSYELIAKIRHMHNNFDTNRKYPRFVYFTSAIYDSSGNVIFSTLEETNVNLKNSVYRIDNNIHFVRLMESYYLGAMYIVIEIEDDEELLGSVKYKVFVYGMILFLILLIAGYFLLKLMLKPMRDRLHLLDKFIKDTTHELNTPISSILANIEMINKNQLSEKNSKKIKRIDIASRTISNLYDDLTYIALGNQIKSDDQIINLTRLVTERVEFFKVIASIKHIECNLHLDKNVKLFIDKNKIIRVIDNLLSNAIKYNKRGSFIKITLQNAYLCIEDGGIGIDDDKLEQMFDRYVRLNDSEGGFGIGLNIVYEIASEYNLILDIESTPSIGTKVVIRW